MSAGFFVTGTDTNVGKTVLSALLVAALGGTYWKPIQTGSTEGTDRQQVMRWADLPDSRALPEVYCFEPPVSPHLAAEWAGARIDLNRVPMPTVVAPPLIVEGAGGVMVPVNESETMLDLMLRVNLPVVIASRTALGTINHTVLTVRALRAAGAQICGVVMIGEANADNERAIAHYGEVTIVGRIPLLQCICYRTLVQTFESEFDKTAFA